MKRLFKIAIIGLCLSISSVAWSYDVDMARSYEKLFSPVAGAKAGKALHVMSPEVLVEKIKAGGVVLIDIRTPAESSVFTVTLPNSLVIPANELFQPENLDLIPKDKQVVIVCKSGTRAIAIGTALRHVGFDNVYILKGGFQALSHYLGAKEANQKPAKAEK